MKPFDPLNDVFVSKDKSDSIDTDNEKALDAAVEIEKSQDPDFEFFSPAAQVQAVQRGSAATPEILNVGDFAPEDFGNSKLDKEVTTPEQMFDLAEHRGQTQSTFDKWANGGMKFVGKTGTNVVGGIVGVTWGALSGLATADFRKVWDNDVLHAMDHANEWMDGALPNHYTRLEREKGLFEQLGTANFWSDQFLNGVSFLAGAALTEAVAAAGGPAALAGNTARLTAQATRMFKTASMLNKASKMRTVMQGAKVAKWTNRIDDTFVLGRQIMTGAGYEAGVESRHSYDAIKDNLITNTLGDLIANTEEALGRTLTTEEKIEMLTPQQKRDIDDQATDLANAVFIGNLALVGYGNMLMLPKLYGSKLTKSISKLPVKNAFVDKAAKKVGMGARGADNLRVAGKVAGRGIYEGAIEEGGQGVIHKAAEDYALINGVGKSQTGNLLADVVESFSESMSQSFGTKEGQTEVLIGILLGLTGLPTKSHSTLGQAISEVKERRSIVDMIEKLATDNPSLLNSVRANSLFFDNVLKRADLFDAALDKGDIATAKNLEFDDFFDFVHAKLQTGQFEDIADQTQEIIGMTDEEFIAFAGYDADSLSKEEIGARKAEVVERVNKRAKAIKESTETVDKHLRMSEADRILNVNGTLSPGYLRRQLIHSLASMDNVDEREAEMITKLAELTGGKVKGDEYDVDTIEYEEDGETREIKIGEFSEDKSVQDIRKDLQEFIEKLEKAEDTPENKKELARRKEQYQQLTDFANQAGPQTMLTQEEMQNFFFNGKEMAAWREEDPEQANVNEIEVAELLRDLRKVRARRQAASERFKLLLDPKTRQKEIARLTKLQEQLTKATDAKTEEDVKAEEEAKKEAKKKAAITMKAFKEKLAFLKSQKQATLADLEAGIKNTMAEMEAFKQEIDEILEKARKGERIYVKNAEGKKVRFSKAKVEEYIETLKGLVEMGNEELTKMNLEKADIEGALAIMDEFEKNPPDLANFADDVNEMLDTPVVSDKFVYETKEDLNTILAHYTKQTEDLNAKLEAMKELQTTLEKFLEHAVQTDAFNDALQAQEQLNEVKRGINNLLDHYVENIKDDLETVAQLKIIEEAYDKLNVFNEILASKGPAMPPSSKELPFEVAETLRLLSNDPNQYNTLALPDIGKFFSKEQGSLQNMKTAGRHSWNKKGQDKEGALETYERLKGRTTLTPEEAKELRIATSQLHFFNFIHNADPNQYYVAAIHKGNIPQELNDDQGLKGMFYTEDRFDEDGNILPDIEDDEKGEYADIKLVLMQRYEYDNKTKSSKEVNRFVRIGEDNTGPLVFTSAMDPTLMKTTEGDAYYRFTNKDDINESLFREQYAAWREEIVSPDTKDIYMYPVTGKSQGSIAYDSEPGPAETRVASSANLKHVKLFSAKNTGSVRESVSLTIPETLDHVMTYPGLPWAFDQVRQVALPMVGRTLDNEEVIDVMNMMKFLLSKKQELTQEYKDTSWDKAKEATVAVEGVSMNVYDALRDMVFLGSDTYYKDKETSDYMFRYGKHSSGQFGFIYGAESTLVTLKDFTEGTAALDGLKLFLSEKYHNFNQKTSDKAVEYTQKKDDYSPKWKSSQNKWVRLRLDSEGNPTSGSEVFDNYNEYLLKGLATADAAPLQTKARKILPVDNSDNPTPFRFMGGYLRFRTKDRKKKGSRRITTLQAARSSKKSTPKKLSTEDKLVTISDNLNQATGKITDLTELLTKIPNEGEVDKPEPKPIDEENVDAKREASIDEQLEGQESVTPESVQKILEFPVEDEEESDDEIGEDETFMRETSELSDDYIKETYAEQLGRVKGMRDFEVIPTAKFLGTQSNSAVAQLESFGRVLIREFAPGGALYHEAFHDVSLYILSAKDATALYDEVRARQGETITFKGETKKMSELTDKEADEWLAEEFRRFILSEGKYTLGKDTVKRSRIQKFFDFIRDFFRAKFGLDKKFDYDPSIQGIEGLFADIAAGTFKTAQPHPSRDLSAQAFMEAAQGQDTDTAAYAKDLVSSLTNYMFKAMKSPKYLASTEKNGVTPLTETDMFLMNLPDSKEGLGKPLLLLYNQAFNEMIAEYNKQIALTDNPAEKNALRAKKRVIREPKLDPETNKKVDLAKQRRGQIFHAHVEFMQQFGMQIDVAQDEDESGRASKNFPDSATAMEISPTDSASRMVKILLGTIPNNENTNLTGLNGVYDMRDVIKIVQNRLEGTMKYSKQLEKLQEIVEEEKYPWAQQVIDRLPDYETDQETTFEDIQLRTQFEGHFSQSHIKHSSIFIGENGRIYDLDPNAERILRIIKRKWEAAGRIKATEGSNHIILNDEGKITFDPTTPTEFGKSQASLVDIHKKMQGASLRYKLNALAHLGFEFSDPDRVLELAEDRERLEDGTLFSDAITDAATYLYQDIIKGELKTFDPFDREETPSVTRFNRLARMELRSFEQNVEFQHQSSDGKIIYGITLNTYLSTLANTDMADIEEYFDPVKNPYIANSLAVQAKRDGNTFKIHNVNGLGIEGAGQRGEKMSKLTPVEIAAVQVHMIMNGKIPMIRAADQTTEFAIEFPIEYKDTIDESMDTILGYLSDEMVSSAKGKVEGKYLKDYNVKIQDLRIFNYLSVKLPSVKAFMKREEITPETAAAFIEDNREDIEKAIKSQFEVDKLEMQNYLEEYGLVEPANDQGNRYIRGISREIFKDSEGNMKSTVSDEKFQDFLETLTVRHFVGKTEIFKTVLGDPAFYKALYKRTKGATGTKKTFSVDPEVDKWLNNYVLQTEGEGVFLGRSQFDGKISDGTEDIVIIQEPTRIAQHLAEYKEMLEAGLWDSRTVLPYEEEADMADGSMIVTLPAYREMSIRAQEWSMEQELAYMMEMFPEKFPNREVPLGTFPPKKFQYFGQRKSFGNDMAPHTYLKMSVAPIFPSLAKKGGELYYPGIMEMYGYLTENSLGGLVLPSATKIGSPIKDMQVDAYTSTFDAYGAEVKTMQFPEQGPETASVLTLDYQFMGSQLDVASKFKGKTPIGTQARVQVLSDLYENGALKYPELRDKVDKYNRAYNELMKKAFSNLLEEFNLERITDQEGNSTFELKKGSSYKAFLDAMEKEAIARELPKALLDSLEYMRNRDAKDQPVVFDLIVNKNRMEGVLWSLAGKRVIRQKFHGDQYVQMSSLGFGVRKQEGTNDVVSERLGFYTNKEGEYVMEVYIPHHFKELIDEDVEVSEKGIIDSNGNVVGDKSLLDLIGIRIPTDGPHSVEVIKVKGFLPRKSGPTVIVPSELVTKSGSDFDIDKLVMYFPAYKKVDGKLVKEMIPLDKNGNPSLSKWFDKKKKRAINTFEYINSLRGDEQGSIDKLMGAIFGTSVLDELADSANIDLSKVAEAKDIPLEDAKEMYDNAQAEYKEFNKTFEEWTAENPTADPYSVATKGALQNMVMDIMKDLLTFEPQRDSFMRPVSTDDMNDLADHLLEVYAARGNKELKDLSKVDNYHSETTLPYMLRAAEAFWKGKALVGIIALASTHHVKSQIAGLNLLLTDEDGKRNKFKTPDNRFQRYKMNFKGFDPEADYLSLGREWDVENERKITDVISQGVNASVDVVNNPTLHILNLSPDNAASWLMLVRAGVPLRSVVYFFNQPIIKDYMKAKEKTSSRVYRAVNDRTIPEKLLNQVREPYGNKRNEVDMLFGSEDLKAMIAKTPETLTDIEKQHQLQLLNDFLTYTNMGEALGNAVNAQSFDTKIPKNRHHLRVILKKYDNVLQSGVLENVEDITSGDTFMKEMTAYNFNMDSMFRDLFLTEQAGVKYEEMYERMVDMYSDPRLRMSTDDVAKVLMKFEEDFVTYVLQTMADTGGTTMGNKIQALMFGENSMAMRLARIQRDSSHPLHNNTFIQSLVPVMATAREGKDRMNDYITPVSRTMTTFEFNTVYDGFKELEQHSPGLAKDLIHTAFFQAGTGQSPYSFLETIPGSSFMEIGEKILDSFRKKRATVSLSDFYVKFYQNNLDNSLIVQKATKITNSILPVTYEYKGQKIFKVNKGIDADRRLSESIIRYGINRRGTSTLKIYIDPYLIPGNQVLEDVGIDVVPSIAEEENEQDKCDS